MIANSHIQLVSELCTTVEDIGIDGLSKLARSAPTELELDAALLQNLVELLKRIVEEQEMPYGYVEPEESKGGNGDGPGGVDPTYIYYTQIEVKDDADRPPDDASSNLDEVKISKSAFPELFPTIEVTKKKHIHKSFPNLDELDGGVHILSGGNFGLTFKSILRGVPVVLKVSKRRSEEANRADYHEWSVSERLDPHPNVLQIIGLCPSFSSPMFTETGTTALIAPLQENGGLREFFDNRNPRRDDVLDIAFGMIVGIRSLHEQRVVHRDIAVRNFLVDCDGRVLLCDFGLTEFLPKGSDVFLGSPSEALPWRTLAPESFANLTFSTKSDIWMYGLALIELISKQAPWPNFRRGADLRDAFTKKELPLPIMEDFPSTISGIIRDCLQFDPKKRPNANDIAERLVKTQFEKLPRHENGNLDLQQCVIDDSTYRVSSLLREDYPHMINKVDFNGNTLLMVAKSEEIRRSILSHRRIPNCNTEPSRIPEYFHNTDVLGSLLRLAKKGDVEAVKSLGRLGLRDLWDEHYEHVAAYKGKNPLHVSAQTGDVAILDAVINLRIFDASKANDDGHTPLHVASIHGHAGVIERLLHLEKGSKTNRGAGTVGTQTAPARSFVNAQDRMGKSALHLAARNGNLYATKALLRNSSTNINIPDTNFQTPIFDSIPEAGSGRAVQIAILEAFLSEPGVSVNEVDSTGETVLHKVARGGFCKSARLLIQRKDLSLSSKERENGDTPLLLATRELSVGVVEALLTREDISINEVDKFGNTPLHILATHFVFSEAMPAAQLALQHKQRRIELSQSDVSINQTGRVRDGGLLYRAAPRDNVGVSNEAPLRLEFDAHATAEDTVDTYVKEEARFNARIKIERLTSLHNAAFEVANLLLSGAGQDVNARDKVLRTPLHMAVSGGNAKFTEFLLSRHDVEADARDKYQRTPLHFAATSGGDEVANMLLSRNDVEADARDESRQTPLHLAARSGDVEVAKVLLSRNDVEADAREESRQTPLHLAAFSGVVEVAKVLIARSDVDINALDEHHKTPLYYAAAMNRVEVTEIFLLQDNIMVNAQDHDQETPLHIATYYSKNELEIVTLFLSRPDVQINPQGYDLRTPLHIAAEKNYFEVAKLFLSRRDVDAEVRDKHGETPLHYAARRESVEVAKLLLSRDDVDVNALNDKRQTLLYLAALGGSVGVTKLLLSRDDVDNNAWDVNGRTPLHIAADKGNNEVAKLLLSSPDVDATARDNRQETPLHRAAAENRVEVANLFLLRDDVDTNAHDVNGKTALDLAEANDAAECVALLLGKEDAESASE